MALTLGHVTERWGGIEGYLTGPARRHRRRARRPPGRLGRVTGVRLAGKVAVVVGAGQTAGETIGNGRATALLFAREGAEVLVVDRDDGERR